MLVKSIIHPVQNNSSCFCQLDRSTREIELGLEYGSPAMNIGGLSLKFEDGQWISGNR